MSKIGDEQKGIPFINFRGTKTDIEALTAVMGGMFAYGWTTAAATDGEYGYYDEVNAVWVWGFSIAFDLAAAIHAATEETSLHVDDEVGIWEHVSGLLRRVKFSTWITDLGAYFVSHSSSTASNDFLVGSGSGAWIKKTLAEVATILRMTLDSVYAAISHTHAAGDVTSGTLDTARLPLSLPLSAANGGTGIANGASASLTLPNLAITLGGGGAAQTYTLPAAGGTFALLNAANVFTTAQKINVNSTTALVVEQDGVKDNVFVVDTTNARINIGNGTHQGATLDIIAPSVVGIETILYATVSDAVGNYFRVSNGTSVAGQFLPVFRGLNSINDRTALIFDGITKDTAGKNTPALSFRAYKSNDTSIANAVIVAFSNFNNAKLAVWYDGKTIIGNSIGVIDNGTNGTITRPTAMLEVDSDSTTTNAVIETLQLKAVVSTASTGCAAGFGVGQSFYAETATDGTNQQQGLISTSWIDATNATRKAKMSLSAYDTAARLGIEIEASGTAVKIGLFGGTTAIQQVLNAYTSDGEGSAYSGLDNLQVGNVYASLTDLNQLRVAYENLRSSFDDMRTKLQTSTLVA